MAVLIMAIACIPLIFFWGEEMDITYLVFFAMICIPMFFDKEDWFYRSDEQTKDEDYYICEWEEE